jgi:dihydroorotase
MRRTRIVGGRVIDPARGVDQVLDVVVEGGRVVGMAQETGAAAGEVVIDARGLVVAPGFVDLHCHLREPGYEHKETIATGTAAALAGGFTTVCAMPNTLPTIDTASDVAYVQDVARRLGLARVQVIGTVTKGQQGQELSEMADMAQAGAVAFSDDGRQVATSRLMRHALEYSLLTGRPIVDHCEDADLAAGTVMNEGPVSARLGLPGVPAEAEEIAVARDLALARLTGGRLHVAHVSTRAAARLIERAKEEGIRVSAEVTPHHLLLTDDWLAGAHATPPYDARCRVNPPLRSAEDCEALQRALAAGVIDCIATDHAPHARVDKECELGAAAPGISGLETAFGLLMRLVHTGRIPLATLIARLTCDPARVFGLDAGSLRPGTAADLVLLDPLAEWTVDAARFRSKGKNTPLDGERLRGRVVLTMVNGTVAHQLEAQVHG